MKLQPIESFRVSQPGYLAFPIIMSTDARTFLAVRVLNEERIVSTTTHRL